MDPVKNKIAEILGADALKYAQNKKKGGDNGKKGTRYEDFYLAYRAAEVAVSYLGKPVPWPSIHGQVLGFVDDVVVRSGEKTEYSQLKNVKTIGWQTGDHPLETDFRYQFQVATALGEPTPLTDLVVSREELKTALGVAIPDSIIDHTAVKYFPYGDGSINRLILENPELQKVLAQLSKKLNPTLDELEGVLGVLVLTGFHYPDGGSVDEIIRATSKIHPNYLCSLNVADVKQFILPGFENALAGITGLAYAFQKGFFSWTAFGMSETFGTDCSTQQFADFQNQVVHRQPMTIDDFEGLLP